ncbi:MAG: hypothetical protein KDF65_00680 [Anaerolineae bacterium]|nr:hypothetical protein [Anaerolineae bacterium]
MMMKQKKLLNLSISVGLSLVLVSTLCGLFQTKNAAAQTTDTTFTFQGRLRSGTDYVNATCKFDFYLFDAASGGNQVGSSQTKTGVAVVDGYFTVALDFGSVFASSARYLEIRNVNCGRLSDPVNLAGRMRIDSAPAAGRAGAAGSANSVDWSGIANLPLNMTDGTDDGLHISCTDDETLWWAGGASGGWTCTSSLNDHSALSGLADDDHPQYLLASGARPMSGTLNMGNNPIANLAPATANGQPVVYEQTIKVGDPAHDDLSGTFPNPTVARLQGQPVAATPPLADQVLTWNGSQWVPAESQAGGPAGGDLNGDYPNPNVIKIQGEAVSGAAPLDMQALRYNNSTSQWEPANVLNNGDAANGDLSGQYPNPSVDGLQGRALSNSTPDTYHVLTWDATAPGGGRWGPEAPQILGPAGGNLSGTFPDPTVAKVQNRPINSVAPLNKQVLTWDGVQWSPANVSSLQEREVSDQSPADTNVLAWNGSQWAPAKVKTLQERPVFDVDPGDKQVLQWDGSRWQPGIVLKPGDAAGGDLSGTFPDPSLGTGVAKAEEVVMPMGYGDGTMMMSAAAVTGTMDLILPATATFVPEAPGKCMVFASSFILSEGSGAKASSDPPPFLRTARKVGSNPAEDDGSLAMYYSIDDVDDDTPIAASANYVWDITQIEVGQPVNFGCAIGEPPDDDWGTDERIHCRVSFICM